MLLAVIQVGLTRTRWGLRTRAVGEHPVAADTVGIRVLAMRYRNVIIAGLIAGIGGAYFTIGSVGSFGPDMSSGEGYIALAAMIFGRYTPFGAIGAALLFGFTTQLQSILSSINVPIQSNLLLLTPYVVTIIVVAGLVGKVRGPPRRRRPLRQVLTGLRFMTVDAQLRTAAEAWLDDDPDERDRAELRALLARGDDRPARSWPTGSRGG